MGKAATAITPWSTAIAVFFYAYKISNSSIAIQMDASRDA